MKDWYIVYLDKILQWNRIAIILYVSSLLFSFKQSKSLILFSHEGSFVFFIVVGGHVLYVDFYGFLCASTLFVELNSFWQ